MLKPARINYYEMKYERWSVMVQVIVNGVAVAKLTEANARLFLAQSRGEIVSQTPNTICLLC